MVLWRLSDLGVSHWHIVDALAATIDDAVPQEVEPHHRQQHEEGGEGERPDRSEAGVAAHDDNRACWDDKCGSDIVRQLKGQRSAIDAFYGELNALPMILATEPVATMTPIQMP